MARRRKAKKRIKPLLNDEGKMVIRIEPWKIPTGHRQLSHRVGPHADKRTKRNRTRGDQKRRSIGEWE